MDAMLGSEEAAPLFDKAIQRFKEVTAIGYLNWGNVFICKGHKAMEIAALAEGELRAAVWLLVVADSALAQPQLDIGSTILLCAKLTKGRQYLLIHGGVTVWSPLPAAFCLSCPSSPC